MVDRFVVAARLAKIREYVALLRKIRGLADERHFVNDPLVYGNAERYLQLSIQAVLDISHHIVADRNLPLPADSRSLFELLARQKVISKAMSVKLAAMAGFRNILVHEYRDRSTSGLSGADHGCSRFRVVHSRGHAAVVRARKLKAAGYRRRTRTVCPPATSVWPASQGHGART